MITTNKRSKAAATILVLTILLTFPQTTFADSMPGACDPNFGDAFGICTFTVPDGVASHA